LKRVVLTPSISIVPLVGLSSPRMHLISTDLPVPEPPITTSDSPLAISRSTPFSTFLGPKDLCRSLTRMLGGEDCFVISLLPCKKQFSDEVVRQQDQYGRGNNRIGGGSSHALCAAA